MTFDEWYRSLAVQDQPQFKDMFNSFIAGRFPKHGKYRIVFSVDPQLWHLDDYVVSSRCGSYVHLVPR